MKGQAADLGSRLWQADDSKTATVRLIALKYNERCESKANCSSRATIGVECRDRIGHPIWRTDFCDEHARPLIAKAQAFGVEVFWYYSLDRT